jgi:hypothetical protein
VNRPCTLILRSKSGNVDRYGDDKPGEQFVPSVWEIQQKQRTETVEGQVSEAEWLAIFLPGTVLDTGDGVVDDELGTFELTGAPWPARNPRTQQESHVEATAKRVAGSGDLS